MKFTIVSSIGQYTHRRPAVQPYRHTLNTIFNTFTIQVWVIRGAGDPFGTCYIIYVYVCVTQTLCESLINGAHVRSKAHH